MCDVDKKVFFDRYAKKKKNCTEKRFNQSNEEFILLLIET